MGLSYVSLERRLGLPELLLRVKIFIHRQTDSALSINKLMLIFGLQFCSKVNVLRGEGYKTELFVAFPAYNYIILFKLLLISFFLILF